MKIAIDNQLSIEPIEPGHAEDIFRIVSENRDHLRTWLPWVDNMQSVTFIENFIKGSLERNVAGVEHACVIRFENDIVGRVGMYKIDAYNRIGEIGYWITKQYEGKGIVSKSCSAMVKFGFDKLNLNRIEIKCGTENVRSQWIPQKLGFTKEGTLRQAELLHDGFIDLHLYSIIKQEHQSNQP